MLGFIDYELLMSLLAVERISKQCHLTNSMQDEHGLDMGSSAIGELFGGAEEDRTPDLLCARQVLSQLSYGPRGKG